MCVYIYSHFILVFPNKCTVECFRTYTIYDVTTERLEEQARECSCSLLRLKEICKNVKPPPLTFGDFANMLLATDTPVPG